MNENHIGGLLYYFCPEIDNFKQFSTDWKTQLFKNHLYSGLLSQLEVLDIEITVLKGAALLSEFYPDKGSRFLGDIDLLIKKEDLNNISKFLQADGFKVIDESKWYGNDFKVVFTKIENQCELVIELYSKLFYTEPPEFQWRTSQVNKATHHLIPEDFLLHLIGHYAYQHTCLKLYWLFDIYFYFEKYKSEIDWQEFYKRAKILGLTNSIHTTLWILEKYFNVTMPIVALINFKLDKRRLITRLISDNFVLECDQRKNHYLLIKHLMRDGFKENLKYDFLWGKKKLLSKKHSRPLV